MRYTVTQSVLYRRPMRPVRSHEGYTRLTRATLAYPIGTVYDDCSSSQRRAASCAGCHVCQLVLSEGSRRTATRATDRVLCLGCEHCPVGGVCPLSYSPIPGGLHVARVPSTVRGRYSVLKEQGSVFRVPHLRSADRAVVPARRYSCRFGSGFRRAFPPRVHGNRYCREWAKGYPLDTIRAPRI